MPETADASGGTTGGTTDSEPAAARTPPGAAAYLDALARALRPLGDPVAVRAAAARVLGAHLGASRVHYGRVSDDGEYVVVEPNYTAGVADLRGRFPMAAFGPTFIAALGTGRTLVVPDLAADATIGAAERDAYAGVGVAAQVGVPLVKDGRLAAVLAVHQSTPRAWTADEVAIIEATAERTWAAVEQTRAEEALSASAARYRALFESLDAGFCVVEMLFDAAGGPHDYRFVETNPAFEQQTGLVDAVGRSARELIPGLESHWFETYGRVATTGRPTRFQQGSAAMGRWFDVYAFPAGPPASAEVAILFTDVSAARAAEREREQLVRALELERSRLADVFRRAPSFIVAFRGPEHVYDFVNEAYYQLVGHREVVGKPLLEAVPEVRDQGFSELLTAVRATGEPWVGHETPVVLQRVPGAAPETRYLDMVFQPLTEADGTRSGVVVHGSDVTPQVTARREVERLLADSERARAEAEAARTAAEAADAAKSQFLANMSHELRTPLNAIQGHVQLLEMGLHGPVTPEQRASLARVDRAQRHLLGLVNDVLNYARLGSGNVVYDVRPLLVADVVADVLPMVEPQTAAKGLTLTVSLPENRAGDAAPAAPVVVWADRERLGQIFLNLLSNAIKFTPPGGRVTVDLTTADGGAERTDVAYFRVADTGIGIPRDKLEAVFEPFVQVRSDYARETGGAGLGLAISRELARGMGGDLRARSTEGAGSVFTVTLRRAGAPTLQPAAAPGASTAA